MRYFGAQETQRGFVAEESESLNIGDLFPFSGTLTEIVEIPDNFRI